jgi:hypothetical protein
VQRVAVTRCPPQEPESGDDLSRPRGASHLSHNSGPAAQRVYHAGCHPYQAGTHMTFFCLSLVLCIISFLIFFLQ